MSAIAPLTSGVRQLVRRDVFLAYQLEADRTNSVERVDNSDTGFLNGDEARLHRKIGQRVHNSLVEALDIYLKIVRRPKLAEQFLDGHHRNTGNGEWCAI